LDGVAVGPHPLDAVRHRHPVRRRDLLLPRRADEPAAAGQHRVRSVTLACGEPLTEGRITVVKLRFACRSCETPARATAPAEWQCPSCDHLLRLAAPAATPTPEGEAVQNCAVCDNREL